MATGHRGCRAGSGGTVSAIPLATDRATRSRANSTPLRQKIAARITAIRAHVAAERRREIQQSLFDRARATSGVTHAEEAASRRRHGVGAAAGERRRRRRLCEGVAADRAASAGLPERGSFASGRAESKGGSRLRRRSDFSRLRRAGAPAGRRRHVARSTAPRSNANSPAGGARCRARSGPRLRPRTVLDVAVAPLLHLLGHDRPVVTPHPLGLCGSISGSDVSLVTLPWSTPVRTAWRDAATRGLAGRAPWAMVSNGRSLRIVDCTRTWTRLGLEFDFEILTASPKGVAALWWLANAEAMRTAGAGSLRASIAVVRRACRARLQLAR